MVKQWMFLFQCLIMQCERIAAYFHTSVDYFVVPIKPIHIASQRDIKEATFLGKNYCFYYAWLSHVCPLFVTKNL